MEQKQTARGRFAPSPSGRMHLGNLFCALVAWLSARNQNAQMLLRVEDLDPSRCRREYERQLEEDLRWLGLDWDEGGLFPAEGCSSRDAQREAAWPDDGGSPAGGLSSYCQSERGAVYQHFFRILQERGLIYPCFCSRDELHAAGAPHQSDGTPRYNRRCLSLSTSERERLAALRPPAWRLRVPDEVFSFEDGCRGSRAANLEKSCGDFIIRRSDGVFAYQLAVVVDDALMGVTEVVRGGDLLDSTPRQLYLYRLLGFSAPRFFHLPLLLAPDGRRLSKRDRDLDCGILRSRFSPEELLGRLGFLAGLLPVPAPVTLRELLSEFCWDKIPHADILVPEELFQ